MGRDRSDRHPSADYAPDRGCGCNAGRVHVRGPGEHGRDHDCNRDRARVFRGSSVLLLRDKVAGDYLAIG